MSVVVVGDVLLDGVVHRVGPVRHGSDTPARIRWRQGGAAANTARWLAADGRAVRLIGRVGDDTAGRVLRGELGAAGVDVDGVALDPSHPTGSVVALVADEERDMLTDRGASAMLSMADLAPGWLGGAAHLHLSGYVLLDGSSRAAGIEALRQAAEAGITISVDPASAAPIRAVGARRLLEWLPPVATVLPNREEAEVLTGCGGAEAAAISLGRLLGEAVVSDAAAGAVWSDGSRVEHARVPRSGIADPVGAGDALTAGWIAARILDARPPLPALRSAVALAARAVRHGLSGSA